MSTAWASSVHVYRGAIRDMAKLCFISVQHIAWLSDYSTVVVRRENIQGDVGSNPACRRMGRILQSRYGADWYGQYQVLLIRFDS